ncbi:MAG: hypothetical protein JXA13_13900 [Anaerolineales bacterium]|nr:hypothetical protein [Anaerolineales bacterium]
MKSRRIWLFLFVLPLAFSFAGCGGSTVKPITTLPRSGFWQGENVFFQVTQDGQVELFNWEIQPATSSGEKRDKCPIRISQPLPIDRGVFELKAEKKTGGVAYDILVIFDSETTAVLSYQYEMCPSTLRFNFDKKGVITFTGETTARWLNP